MMMWRVILFLLASGVQAEPVTVFAAASLKTALEDIAEGFDGEVVLSFASSAVLARQVTAGAPADVFISANVAWMDWVARNGVVLADTRRDILGNRLVVVQGREVDARFEALGADVLHEPTVAMGLLSSVPAGIYGRQAFEALGFWERVAPGVVQVDNVRAALALVALGEVPFGVVYASDAVAEPRVRVAHVFDPSGHDPIVYPGVAITEAGRAFLAHLSSERAGVVFEAQGFEALR